MHTDRLAVDIKVPNQTRYLCLIGHIGENIARTLKHYGGDREKLAYDLNLVLTEAMANASSTIDNKTATANMIYTDVYNSLTGPYAPYVEAELESRGIDVNETLNTLNETIETKQNQFNQSVNELFEEAEDVVYSALDQMNETYQMSQEQIELLKANVQTVESLESYEEKAEGGGLKAEVAVKWGDVKLKTLGLELPSEGPVKASLADKPVGCRVKRQNGKAVLTFDETVSIKAGDRLAIEV